MWGAPKAPVFDGNRLKVDLKLCAQRLSQAQRKRANQNLITRREIAKLLSAGKESSARVKTEFVIKDDEIVESMELLELFCNLLSARFGLLTSMPECDESIKAEVCSIIWVAPRMSTDIRELDTLKKNLIAKYGPVFAAAAAENKDNCVDEKLFKKMDVRPPSKKLINAYLEAIAETHNVQWEAPLGSPPEPLEIDEESQGDLIDLSYQSPMTEPPTIHGPRRTGQMDSSAIVPPSMDPSPSSGGYSNLPYPTLHLQPKVTPQPTFVRGSGVDGTTSLDISGAGFDALAKGLSETAAETPQINTGTPYPSSIFAGTTENMSVYPPKQSAEAPPSYTPPTAPVKTEDTAPVYTYPSAPVADTTTDTTTETPGEDLDDLAARLLRLKKT